MARYRELRNLRRIRFVTFHPSFSYEEFVEGIRPTTLDNGSVHYEVRAGILKQAVTQARELFERRSAVPPGLDLRSRKLFKMSLGDISLAEESWIFGDCIENGYACIGFAPGVDFSGADDCKPSERYVEATPGSQPSDYAATAVHYLERDPEGRSHSGVPGQSSLPRRWRSDRALSFRESRGGLRAAAAGPLALELRRESAHRDGLLEDPLSDDRLPHGPVGRELEGAGRAAGAEALRRGGTELRPHHRRDQSREPGEDVWRVDHVARAEQAAGPGGRAGIGAALQRRLARCAPESLHPRHDEHRGPLDRAHGHGAAPPVRFPGDAATAGAPRGGYGRR